MATEKGKKDEAKQPQKSAAKADGGMKCHSTEKAAPVHGCCMMSAHGEGHAARGRLRGERRLRLLHHLRREIHRGHVLSHPQQRADEAARATGTVEHAPPRPRQEQCPVYGGEFAPI